MIKTTYDLICLILIIAGVLLAIVQLYLHDWSIEAVLFDE